MVHLRSPSQIDHLRLVPHPTSRETEEEAQEGHSKVQGQKPHNEEIGKTISIEGTNVSSNVLSSQINHLISAPRPTSRETEKEEQVIKMIKIPTEGTCKTLAACGKLYRRQSLTEKFDARPESLMRDRKV